MHRCLLSLPENDLSLCFSPRTIAGTPINRIPIMAKQILDLYMLYKLVTEKGGLVEIINKKIERDHQRLEPAHVHHQCGLHPEDPVSGPRKGD